VTISEQRTIPQWYPVRFGLVMDSRYADDMHGQKQQQGELLCTLARMARTDTIILLGDCRTKEHHAYRFRLTPEVCDKLV